ncbi:stealth family protein [Enterococcus gallinarum]|uniref:stealth family protein n=1 Tax=Enterococcus gallinarum TaxID=1353 RepID=UPI003369D10C
MKIDFVVTWVDGSDEKWQEEKKFFLSKKNKNFLNDESRYRDFNFFKFWFRSVEKYAPWVNKIFLITAGHTPEWLNLYSEKLVVISHREYIPDKYLPTFNSNVIELNLHRIDQLSEHFVLFNDDVYLNNPVQPSDFFLKGLPREIAVYSLISPVDEFSMIMLNNIRIINKNFSKYRNIKNHPRKIFNLRYGPKLFNTIYTLITRSYTGYYEQHITSSMLKSTFTEVWEKEYETMEETSLHRFREMTDVNQWLIKYWNIETDKFEPQNINFGKAYSMNDYTGIKKCLFNSSKKIICINDTSLINHDSEKVSDRVSDFLMKKFPDKSIFEKKE